MSRNIFFNWSEYYREKAYYEKAFKEMKDLYTIFKEWDGVPRIEDGYSLPWKKYTRHNWIELYTHFLYYPFYTFKEFAECYGLNYKSSQTWKNQHIPLQINGDWKWNKRHWLMGIVESNDTEIMEELRYPDKNVMKYKPFS